MNLTNRAVILLLLLIAATTINARKDSLSEVKTVEDLKNSIEEVLARTNTPSVGLAIVGRDSIYWLTSIGKANLEKDIDANENTMYRIGSISKMFVSLSILKLQEEGKVSLLDTVRRLVPEIEFQNKWEESNPILVAHLLEHTTGWDDVHLTEYAHNDSTPATLKEGLDYHPHSRICRWVPGTRTSYCNSGPPVAAYIIEKITGQLFEDYVRENFFDPLQMKTATYFYSDEYQKRRAILYDKSKPQFYWHIIMRPSGSVNASPKDMAKFVRFFINRGWVDSVQLVSPESLVRMETPGTNLGVKSGIEIGYALSNYTNEYNGHIYHGHNGGVNGGLSELAYLPEKDLGHIIMINSGSNTALNEISDIIKHYETNVLTNDHHSINFPNVKVRPSLEGYFVLINPRQEFSRFLQNFFGIRKFHSDDSLVYSTDLFGKDKKEYVQVSNSQFISQKTGMVSMVKIIDPLAGDAIQEGTRVFKPVTKASIFIRFFITGLWILGMAGSLILSLVWFIYFLRGDLYRGLNLQIRIWPFITTLLFIITFILFAVGANNPFMLLATRNPFSVSIFMVTVLYAISAVGLFIICIRSFKIRINRFVYWYSTLLSVLQMVVVIYLINYDIIGVRSWA